MEFRTKREALRVIEDVEHTASRWDRHAEWNPLPAYQEAAKRCRAEAARIRDLLPGLPEEA